MNPTIEQHSATSAAASIARVVALAATNHRDGVRCFGTWPTTKSMTATTYHRPRGTSRQT